MTLAHRAGKAPEMAKVMVMVKGHPDVVAASENMEPGEEHAQQRAMEVSDAGICRQDKRR